MSAVGTQEHERHQRRAEQHCGADPEPGSDQHVDVKRRIAARDEEGGRIVGIVSERDVVYCLREHGREALDWPVERAMSSPAITADPTTDVLAALALMTQRRIRHLPVVEHGEIRGIVSIGDLVKYRMERIEAEAEAMRAYIQSA